jgi:hypothetical protein
MNDGVGTEAYILQRGDSYHVRQREATSVRARKSDSPFGDGRRCGTVVGLDGRSVTESVHQTHVVKILYCGTYPEVSYR